ncbi:hypothetical protein [Rhodanobacter sp. BL-MT-08]
MSAIMDSQLTQLCRQWDAMAIDQLRAEVARLCAENEALQERAERAERDADWYAQDAQEMHLQLCEATGGLPGITIDGALVITQATP